MIKASTGALVKVLAGTTAHPMFADPVALADAGSTVWVADESKNAVSEITTTPVLKVTRALSGPTFGFHGPDGLAYADGYLWVANGDTAYNTVTKFQAPSGDSPQIITNSDGNYGFWNPGPMTSSGGMVYVASPPGGSPMVTQIQASTDNGNWMECNTNDPSPDFQDPSSIAVLGPDVFVTNATGNSISPLLVTTGQFLNEVG